MDKNMINIDDLVRLRLTGGEEKERPGAWLQMKDLLDKEMPAKVAAGYNWRRAFTAAALLLLVGTATIGSYKLYTSKMAEGGEGSRPVASAPVTEGGATGAGGVVSAVAEGGGVGDGGKATNSTEGGMTGGGGKQNNTKTVVAATTTHTKSTKSVKHTTVNNVTEDADNQKVNHVDVAAHAAKHTKTISAASNDANVAKENTVANTDQPKSTKKNHSNKVFASGDNLPKHGLKNTKNPGNGNGSANGPAIAKGNKNNNKKNTAPANAVSPAPGNPVPPVYSYGGGVTAPASNKPVTPKQSLDFHKTNPRYVDSAEYTYVHEKIRRGSHRMDTIDKGTMAIGEKEFASATKPETAKENVAGNKQAPNAEAPAVKDTKLTRAERKALNAKYDQPSLWERMVDNVKPNFSEVSFHPGLMLGLSSTVGKYNMWGVQGGFSGTLNLSEHFGILAELKYLYRFGNGKSLENDYNSLDGEREFVSNNYYKYKVDSQEHAFNITSSGLVELPIAIKYSANKLNFFAGANLAYNFAVNVEERFGKVYASNQYGNSTKGDELQTQWKNNNDPKLTPTEFGSRMSLGYMLGVGYQVTPLIGLDLRASQVFWDNSKVHSAGAFIVSKELYRAPCFQFNMTYRLQRNANRKGPMKAR